MGTEAFVKAVPFIWQGRRHEMLNSHVSISSELHEILKMGIMVIGETNTKGRL
jgi:hypothetical protein